MVWFFQNVYPYLIYVFLVALGASLYGRHLVGKGEYGAARTLFLVSFILDLVMVAGYGAALVVMQDGMSAIMLALWILFSTWGYRNLKALPKTRTKRS